MQQILKTMDLKELFSAEHEYMNMNPPFIDLPHPRLLDNYANWISLSTHYVV